MTVTQYEESAVDFTGCVSIIQWDRLYVGSVTYQVDCQSTERLPATPHKVISWVGDLE